MTGARGQQAAVNDRVWLKIMGWCVIIRSGFYYLLKTVLCIFVVEDLTYPSLQAVDIYIGWLAMVG